MTFAAGWLAIFLTGCFPADLATRGAPDSAVQTMIFELPPVELPAGTSIHVNTPAQFEKVALAGWVHGFDVTLRDGAGRELPRELLHHTQVMLPGQRELLHPIMLRLVGAGSETDTKSLPAQLGFHVMPGDSLLLVAMLHNPTGRDYGDVRVRLHLQFSTTGPWRPPLDVFPFFTHVIAPPGEPAYDLPSGESERTLDIRFPVSGKILALGGHLHTYGHSLTLEDGETGESLWESVAAKDADGIVREIPHDIFIWSGGLGVEAERTYRFRVRYDNPGASIPDGGMGTLGGVFLPDGAWPAVDPNHPVYQWDWAKNTTAPGAHEHVIE
ncbi:MAG: hypothetical protein WEG36_13355 [Gemmatimonadota bacterium]